MAEETTVTDASTGQVYALSVAPTSENLQITISADTAMKHLSVLQDFVKRAFTKDDFGTLPGTGKKMLFKSGAEKLLEIYSLYADVEIIKEVRDTSVEPAYIEYVVKCTIRHKVTGRIYSTELGSCNSWESKYRWREARKKCPACGKETLGTSKKEWGGGYYCNGKIGGCGAAWKGAPYQDRSGDERMPSADDLNVVAAINAQATGRVTNPDIWDSTPTILKMAAKRGVTGATIRATRSSGVFESDEVAVTFHGGSEESAHGGIEESAIAEILPAATVPASAPASATPKNDYVTASDFKIFLLEMKEQLGLERTDVMKLAVKLFKTFSPSQATYSMLERIKIEAIGNIDDNEIITVEI